MTLKRHHVYIKTVIDNFSRYSIYLQSCYSGMNIYNINILNAKKKDITLFSSAVITEQDAENL